MKRELEHLSWMDRWGALVLGVIVPIMLAVGVTAYLLP